MCGDHVQGMTAKHGHGELLLLKLIVAGLQQDLQARLAIYTALCKASSAGAGTASSKKSMLLQGSVLWRLLTAVRTSSCSVCLQGCSLGIEMLYVEKLDATLGKYDSLIW